MFVCVCVLYCGAGAQADRGCFGRCVCVCVCVCYIAAQARRQTEVAAAGVCVCVCVCIILRRRRGGRQRLLRQVYTYMLRYSMPLYIFPHPTVYTIPSLLFLCTTVRASYYCMCPHTTTYVSSCYTGAAQQQQPAAAHLPSVRVPLTSLAPGALSYWHTRPESASA